MNSPYYRSSSYEEQQLYDHLIACRKIESPEQLLERFHYLFIEGVQYSHPNILEILRKLVTSPTAEDEFRFILNRCCRILINYWWFQPPHRWAIAELVDLLHIPARHAAPYPYTQQLRHLVRQFTFTEEYQSLQRLALVVEENCDLDSSELPVVRRSRSWHNPDPEQKRSLRNLIHRYPYLYPYCLTTSSSDSEFETIRHIQAKQQEKYERDLSRYVTALIQQGNGSRSATKAVKNPTLLTEAQLRRSIKHFTGKVEQGGTYKNLAQRFLAHGQPVETYREFKERLYRYLVASVEAVRPEYGKHHFNQWLYLQLKNTLPQCDTQTLNNFLITRTYHQLIESFIANPQNVSNHLVFVDLITNVGATVTVGILLKLLLLCKNLRSSLEKRLALLYKHYEPVMDGVEWLVESLENLQIAFSLHFGSINIPCLSRL